MIVTIMSKCERKHCKNADNTEGQHCYNRVVVG
jgi:hypothetical protein